jgi:uncharacterized NAD(P)/FAD-binding protein YdhS
VKTVAIVGGGFCGTLTAVNLARSSPQPLQVVLVNCRYPLGRGVAYGTPRPEHLLNVAARNMSAFPDLPSHFVDWLRTRADFADVPMAELREQFIPRRVYGDYLQNLLFTCTNPLVPPAKVKLETVDDEVVDIVPNDHGAQVLLKSGRRIEANRVLIASGNPAPQDVLPPNSVQRHVAYRENPWQVWLEGLPDSKEDVLLIGTGLTMIDVVLTLQALGWRGKIYAVSRHGLLPLSHFKGSDYTQFPPDSPWTMGLSELRECLEEHCAKLRNSGINPAILVDKLRPFTQRIWRSLSLAEKREFNRDYRTEWNVVRHRIPPAVARQIEKARDDGLLRIVPGRIREAAAEDQRIQLTIDPTNGRPSERLTVGLLVNCTGPRESFADAPDPLFQNLYKRGLAQSDALDMGLEVTPDFAVVDRLGQPSNFLFAIGSLLKGTLWETTAVPELRAQTQQVAQILLADAGRQSSEWTPETPENLIEYYI